MGSTVGPGPSPSDLPQSMPYPRMHLLPGQALRTDLTVVKPPTTVKGTGTGTMASTTVDITAVTNRQ